MTHSSRGASTALPGRGSTSRRMPRRAGFVSAAACALILTACASSPPTSAVPTTPSPTSTSSTSAPVLKWSESCGALQKIPGRDAQRDALVAVLDRMFVTYTDAQVEGFLDNECAPDEGELLSLAWAHYLDPSLQREALHTTSPDDVTVTAAYRDAEGYSFTVEARVPGGIRVTTESASQKPGRVQVRASFDASASVTNTTPGRITRYVPFALVPVWAPDSEVCRTLTANNAGVGAWIERRSGDWGATGFCTAGLVVLQPPGGEGGVVEFSLQPGATTRLADSNPATEGNTAFVELNAAESSVAPLTSAFTAPAFWALAGPDGAIDAQDGFCRIPSVIGDDWIVYDTTTGGAGTCLPVP